VNETLAMTKSASGFRLYTAATISLIVMTGFGSAALAQQPQTPPPSWHGTFEWKHVCQGGGSTDETRGVGKLELTYSAFGFVGQGWQRPDSTLNGTLTGTIPERSQTIPPCSFTYVAPGTFSARVAGSYTPAQNAFSAHVYNVNSTPGRASFACPQAPATEVDQAYFTVYEGPMFEDAFRELRRAPDGSLKSKGERTVSVGASTCTTTYALTLYGCGENMPERGVVYAGGSHVRVYSAPSADSSILGSLPGGVRIHYAQTRHVNGQTWFFIVHAGQRGWGRASDFSCGLPMRPPVTPRELSPELRELYNQIGTPRPTAAGGGARG
jgi:hypothetical protein